MDIFLPCLYSFAACLGYCLRVNLRGRKMVLASLGGAIGWLFYLLFSFTGYELLQVLRGPASRSPSMRR